jgi:hypothetical protein
MVTDWTGFPFRAEVDIFLSQCRPAWPSVTLIFLCSGTVWLRLARGGLCLYLAAIFMQGTPKTTAIWLPTWHTVVAPKTLRVDHLVNKLSTSYGPRKFTTVFTKSAIYPCPEPDKFNRQPPTLFHKIHFNIMIQSISSVWSFPSALWV